MPPWLAVALATFPADPAADPVPPAAPLLRGPVALDLHGLVDLEVRPEDEKRPAGAARARIGLHGRLPEDLHFVFEADVAEPEPEILDAEIVWARFDFATLVAGAGKPPFSRQGLVPAAFLQIPRRAIAMRTDREGGAVPDRRLGGALGGDLGLIAYGAGIYQGRPGLPPDHDAGVAGGWLGAGRVELRPLGPIGIAEGDWDPTDAWYTWPRLALGGSYFAHRDQDYQGWGAGGDAAFKLEGLSCSGEIIYAKTEEPLVETRLAAYGQAGWFAWPGLVEIVARYDWTDSGEWAALGGAALWLWQGHARLHVTHAQGSDDATRIDLVGRF
ncbi:MAG: hypothetical protein AABZ30_13745 [Myxococcota bacterium]|mgnify:CR=1 FL=1